MSNPTNSSSRCLARRTYWAILDQHGVWMPASLHLTRTSSIKRGMQVCFPVKFGLVNDESANRRAWQRCKRWGYRCMRVTVSPSAELTAKGYPPNVEVSRRIVGWTNDRDISPRHHGTPRYPLTIFGTRAEARREFGLDAVRVEVVPANAESSGGSQKL